jgi:hypothetical protein
MRRAILINVTAIAAIGALFFSLPSADAATIHTQWTMESPTTPPDVSNSVVGPPVLASTGVGTATGLHASVNTDWSTPVGNGSAESYSSNEWTVGDYYQFQTSTLGVGGVQLSWAQSRSSTGPANFDLRYSTDGINFTTAMSYVVSTVTFSSVTFKPEVVHNVNLQSINELNNQPSVYFRLVAASAPTSTGGTSRVDDFTVFVPEPASIGLMLLAGVALVGLRRRASR